MRTYMNNSKNNKNKNKASFRDISCFLYGIKEQETDALLKTLAKVSIANDLDANMVSLFANSNYNSVNPNDNGNIFSEEAIKECIKELLTNEKKTTIAKYCKERSKLNSVRIDECFRTDCCSLCEYSPVYANYRKEVENTVLAYSFLHGVPVELTSHSRKSMTNAFKSCIQLTITENGNFPIFSLNCALATALNFQRLPLTQSNLNDTADEFTARIFDVELKRLFDDSNVSKMEDMKKTLRYHVYGCLKRYLTIGDVSKEDCRDALTLLEIPYMQYLASKKKEIPDKDILTAELVKKEKARKEKESKGAKNSSSVSNTDASLIPNFFSIFSAYAADIPDTRNDQEQNVVQSSSGKEETASKKNQERRKKQPVNNDNMKPETDNVTSKSGEKPSSKKQKDTSSNADKSKTDLMPDGKSETIEPAFDVDVDVNLDEDYLLMQADHYMEPEIPDDIPSDMLYQEDDFKIEIPSDFTPDVSFDEQKPQDEQDKINSNKKKKQASKKEKKDTDILIINSDNKCADNQNDETSEKETGRKTQEGDSTNQKSDNKDGTDTKKQMPKYRERDELFLNIPFVSCEEVNDIDTSSIDLTITLDGLLKRSEYIKVDAAICNKRIGLLFFDDENNVNKSSFFFTSGCESIIKDVFRSDAKHIFTSNSTRLYYVLGMYDMTINAHIHSLEHMCDVLNSENGKLLTIDSYIKKIMCPKQNWDANKESYITYSMKYYESLRLHLFNSDTEQSVWNSYFAVTGLEKALALYTPYFKLKDNCIHHKGYMKYSFQETEVDHDCIIKVSVDTDKSHPLLIDRTPIYYHLCNAYVNARTFQSFFLDIINITKSGIKLHYRTNRKEDLIDALWCLAQKECLRFYETTPSILVEEIA